MNTKPIEHPAYRRSLRRTLKFIGNILLMLGVLAFIMFILPTIAGAFYWIISPLLGK